MAAYNSPIPYNSSYPYNVSIIASEDIIESGIYVEILSDEPKSGIEFELITPGVRNNALASTKLGRIYSN